MVLTSKTTANLYPFMQKNRPWEGIMAYKWLSKAMLILSMVLGLGFIRYAVSWWDSAFQTNQMSIASIGNFVGSAFQEGYDLIVVGGLKYVVLILVEVLIFHFTRRTLEIISGDLMDTSFKTFVRAQKRMIKIAIYSYFLESILSIIVGIFISMFGLTSLKPMIVLLIQSFFLGYAIIDNYNEIYHMTMKQSLLYTRQYIGVALTIGVGVYFIMLVPLVGTLLGPILGAVVATTVMHLVTERDQAMDWVFDTRP